MLVYFSFLIPVVIAILLFIFFRHKIVWWEIVIPMVVSVLLVLGIKAICISSLTSDTEWWGGFVTDVRYYESWDEEVPCRHAKYCERRNSCCSRDTKGNCESCTETYQCGWEHAYDVDYHPKHWVAVTTLGDYGIREQRYNELAKQFGTEKKFVDMHRDYHSIDGDQYRYDWSGEDKTLEPVARSHSYENRPMASHSIYHYEEVDTFDIRTYKPFEYPEITNTFHQEVLLGYSDKKAERRLQVLNSRLGESKEIRVYFLVFRNQTREAGFIQERYWQGGNKNELVVCVGLDTANNVTWGHAFSWTEQTAVKIKIQHQIEELEKLDINKVIDIIDTEIKEEWIRKPFKEFDYLTIEPTMTQVVWIMVLTLVVNVGIAVWIVKNEFEIDKDGKQITRW